MRLGSGSAAGCITSLPWVRGSRSHGESWRRCPVLAGLPRPVPDDLRDAVIELGVQLGELVAGVDGRLGDVTDGCGLDDVTDDELPDGLILGATAGAVCAADVLDVSAAVFGASSVASFFRHIEPLKIQKLVEPT